MTTENIIKLNQIIGGALREAAHEAYLERIERMKARPFDEVIEALRTLKETGHEKAAGYFATDALRHLDERLEKEDTETWLEIKDDLDADWFKAVEQFRW